MIDKPDPAKDAGRADTSGAKRPHATLDIKATEVKPPPAQGASAATAATDKPAPDASAASASSSSSSAASSAGKTTSASDASAKAPPAGSATKPSASASPSKTESKPASGGGFFSHVAAGLAGGALVYVATLFAPNVLPGISADRVSQLATRIAAIESAPQQATDLTALNAKVAEAERRGAKIDEIERNLAALTEKQAALETESKSLGATVQSSGGAASAERISKLEEQLNLIASGSGGASGSVPQLAAVTGKISDLETSLGAQIADVRKGMPAEIEQRLASAHEASEAAKAASLRLERELAQIRTDQARSAQRDETAKADGDRLTAAVEAVKEETGRLSSTVGELRSSIDSQLKEFVRIGDISAAVNPVNSKIAEIEQNVQSVVKSEESRRENAERIVLSLELSNLKRALDRGQGVSYAAELEEVKKAAAGQLDLSPLERFKDTGVATTAQLKSEFRPLINAVLDADLEPADGSIVDRLLAGAKSVVRVRKVSHEAEDTSTEALVARMEVALDEGRLGDVLAQAKALPQRARIPIEDWLIKVTARDTVDQAIASVDERLKASLAGAPDGGAPAPAAQPAP